MQFAAKSLELLRKLFFCLRNFPWEFSTGKFSFGGIFSDAWWVGLREYFFGGFSRGGIFRRIGLTLWVALCWNYQESRAGRIIGSKDFSLKMILTMLDFGTKFIKYTIPEEF